MPETTLDRTPDTTVAGPLLRTLRGENLAQRPIWLMRQAGRYLPEYRELRAEKGGFLALVYDTDAAAEVTVQPIRRFGFDGAILFSDILIVPYAMGQDLRFLVGEGPGAGIALMLVLFGILGTFVGIGGYAVRAVRDAEDLLPDHDAAPRPAVDDGSGTA